MIARSLKIHAAVDPSENMGIFWEAFVNTMSLFECSDSGPQSALTRYIAIDPVKPEFEVYESSVRYEGLQSANLVGRNASPEVGVHFMQELVSLIRAWYIKEGNGDVLNTIPLPDELE